MDRRSTGLGMLALTLLVLAGLAASGCSRAPSESLLLAQAQFPEGNTPGAAKLSILHPPEGSGEPWTEEVITDPDSNVFHKALAWELAPGDPGILTIGAEGARLVFWRGGPDGWTPQVLYEDTFGGEFNRLRDMEIGDVTGDGRDEIVVATHDQGVILVFDRGGEGVTALEIDRKPDTFVHEIELGDVDGDGVLEIFATPSARNVAGDKEQPGDIVMFRYEEGEFRKTVIEHFTTRHVKEILWYEVDGADDPTLYAAVEGEAAMAGGAGGEPSLLKVYHWRDGKFVGEDVTSLPGKLCRFLNGGDTDGDGVREIVASTAYNGIYKIWREEGEWRKKKIVPETVSSGFEHATVLFDLDGDGADEILVASDKQDQVNCFDWNPDKERYDRKELRKMKLDFTWNITTMPDGWGDAGSR
jgi:hypothetical protein